MKRILSSLICLFLAGLANYTFADYPIVGYSYLADPGAIYYNGRVYVYCSNDNENPPDGETYDMSSIVCVSSSDLKNWTNHGIVFDVPRDASWSNLSWAPSPAYKNGKFYLYFGNGGSAIGVAVADNPLGPFKDPVGRSIANGSTPGVQPFDGWLFDPMTFIDDDGQAYMYFGGNGDGNMRVAKLNEDMISINGSCGKITVPNLFEAAWVHKHNGTYYFSYSTNPANGMRIDYMTSKDPMTGFTYGGIMSPQPPINNNNNHQAVVEIEGKWYQIYHNRIVARDNNVGMPYHRNLAIDEFTHNADGSINTMKNTVDGVTQIRYLDPYIRQEGETMSNQSGIDVENCSAGGMDLAYIDNGDWIMVEGVDFGSAGAGSFSASVASEKTGGTIEIRLGSTTGTLAGTMQVPNTGGYQDWQTELISLEKITGVHNVYFVFKGSGASLFNIDHWKFYSSGPIVDITAPALDDVIFVGDEVTISATAEPQEGTVTQVEFFVDGTSIGVDKSAPYSVTHTFDSEGEHVISVKATDSQNDEGLISATVFVHIPQGPFGGVPHAIPGIIQLEEYDVGGNGFAYYDETEGNEGGADYRLDEDVDLEDCTDTDGGYNLGWATAGEWVEYTVDVKHAGSYKLTLRAACNGDDRTLSLFADDQPVAADIAISSTEGWQEWADVVVENVELKEGVQVLKLLIGETDFVNINYMEFESPFIAPEVTITSPADKAEVYTGKTVSIAADASATDATVAQVAFYAGDDLIGIDKSAPYAVDWSDMLVGTYTIRAVVTDSNGSTSSDEISLTVTDAPVVVTLKKGWNLIGYPKSGSEPIEDALSSIMDKVEVVKDFDGFHDSAQPVFLNSLLLLKWGKGYMVKVSEDCELLW